MVTEEERRELLLTNSKEWLVDELLKTERLRHEKIEECEALRRTVTTNLSQLLADLKHEDIRMTVSARR
jgi:hypothetical protein